MSDPRQFAAMRRRQRGYIIDPFRADAGGGGGGPTDPYFATVVNLTHFDGTDGQTGSFTNSCPYGNMVGASAGTGELDTAIKKFGTASLLRTSGSASVPAANSASHADYKFGTNDFTVEFWYYLPNVAGANYNMFGVYDTGGAPGASGLVFYTYSNGRIGYYANGVERIVSGAGVIANATWYAIAYSRVSGTGRLFVEGTQVGSSWSDTINYNNTSAITCATFTGGNPPSAQWDEIRISNGLYGSGAGRYSGNYTPATAAFPDS